MAKKVNGTAAGGSASEQIPIKLTDPEVQEGKEPRESFEQLVIGLADPGMSPMMRAGLGGLAASIRAIALKNKGMAGWPERIPVGEGEATVEKQRVILRWPAKQPKALLEPLFLASFRLTDKVIELPGVIAPGRTLGLPLAVALQVALKKTFLQHGTTTTKDGAEQSRSMEIDDRQVNVKVQGYSSFAHQLAWEDILKGMKSGEIGLPGWAHPGAVERHKGHGATEITYTPAQAIAALFALVGCLTFEGTKGGAIVIPEPLDLLAFAAVRPRLTPQSIRDTSVASASDAVLSMTVALKLVAAEVEGPRAIARAHGITLRSTPWASQQKSRISTVTLERFEPPLVDLYAEAMSLLPTRLIIMNGAKEKQKGKGKAGAQEPKKAVSEVGEGYFMVPSVLRGFIADNLAAGRPWFTGFATATVGEKKRLNVHQFYEPNGLGALRFEEKKGLCTMVDKLEQAELTFVKSVHTALRQRFGAIAEETKSLSKEGKKNRFRGERDRWRLAFAGAKTHEQVRAALADLWSRAGSNKELQASLPEILPLLRADRWMAARDLALVALASYQGKKAEDKEIDELLAEESSTPDEPTEPSLFPLIDRKKTRITP